MACATLKRSLDFDPVHMHGRPPKRQRCIPMNISPSSSPPASRNEGNPSPFSELCPKMTPGITNLKYYCNTNVISIILLSFCLVCIYSDT